MLRVADLMTTGVITVKESEPDLKALAEMDVGQIRHLPVVDGRGKLVGILSDRDLRSATASKRPRRVAELMTSQVLTIGPDTPAHEAAVIMLQNKISSLPVVDEHGTLVGLVTQTDYLELARRALLGLPLGR